jgi:type VI secretion system protein ImpK
VVVVGHTDDTRPRLSARLPSNFDLSKARARNVAALLAERAGPPERYASEGRGETEPLAPNDGPANRARNRRVDIILLTPPQPR